MKKLLNPAWIYLVNTLPLTLLIIILWIEYSTVKRFLDPESISAWYKSGVGILVIMLIHGGYAWFAGRIKQKVSLIYSFVSILLCTGYLYVYYFYGSLLLFYVPSWISSGDQFFYIGAFFMPAILYAFMCIVVTLTEKPAEKKIWINLLIMVAIPVLFYVFIIYGFHRSFNFLNSEHFLLLCVIGGTALLLFFFLRLLYIVMAKSKKSTIIKPVLIFLFGLVFPVAGLLLNQTDSIFGDFSDNMFFVLAVLNGLLLLIPSPDNNKKGLLVLYGLRFFTFPYTVYFLFVFLPLLPLSVIFILLAGTGLLMLTPIILFALQSNILFENYKSLRKSFNLTTLILVPLVACMIVPAGVVLDFYHSKKVLHETLEYVYSPDYNKQYKLNKKSIEKTLKASRQNTGYMAFYSTTPYLNTLYRKIVLGNMGLATDKKSLLETLLNDPFYYPDFYFQKQQQIANKAVKIISRSHESQYDPIRKVWCSTIHLNIENQSAGGWNNEYLTYFDLPAGCWISDYYLVVNGIKDPGILAERKSATWIYNQIRNRDRDPGLLNYVGGNTIEFKVFPFTKNEVRETGIEFIHPYPIELQIDDCLFQLGDYSTGGQSEPVSLHGEYLSYITAEEKEQLPNASPEPYYHFIVDISETALSILGNRKQTGELRRDYEACVESILSLDLLQTDSYKVTYANSVCFTKEEKVNTGANINWEKGLPSGMKPLQHGFFLQRAIEEVLVHNYRKDKYPVIIVLSQNLPQAIVMEGFKNLQFTYPFMEHFYCVYKGEYLELPLFGEWNPELKDKMMTLYKQDSPSTYYRRSDARQRGIEELDLVWEENIQIKQLTSFHLPEASVKKWGEDYLPDDGKPSYVLHSFHKTDPGIQTDQVNPKDLQSALLIQGRQMMHYLNPSLGKKEWVSMLRASFKSRILTPVTSYIVVETKHQRMLLEEKQQQVMEGNLDMDITDEILIMSEPDLYLLLFLLLGFVVYNRRKQIKSVWYN